MIKIYFFFVILYFLKNYLEKRTMYQEIDL